MPPILALPGQSVGSWAHHIGFFERELPPIRMEFSSDGQFLMVNPPTSQYMLLVKYKSTPSAILHNIHSFIPILLVLSCSHENIYWLVVWNIFLFSHRLGIIIPTDFHIFQGGVETTNVYIYIYIHTYTHTYMHIAISSYYY